MAKKHREKPPKPAKDTQAKDMMIEPLDREIDGVLQEPYRIMDALIDAHHRDLLESEARIAIAWDLSPAKEDVDGKIKFGRVKKGDDILRTYGANDFWLIIRSELWAKFAAEPNRREAEIDRMLCRCGVERDKHGEVRVYKNGHSVFRLRRPVEVFPENVRRFGFHQEPKLADMLQHFNDSKRTLFNQQNADKTPANRFNEPAMGKPAAAETNGHANGKPKGKGKSKAKADPPTEEDTGALKSLTDIPIEAIEPPFPIVDILADADLHSLADLMRYEEEHGQLGISEIKDMGVEKAEILRECLVRYREANPAIFEAAQVS